VTHDVGTMCNSCGTWHWAGDSHTCSRIALYLPPGLTPTDLPGQRAGTTYRFRVNDDRSLTLCARLEHDAAPALIGVAL